MLQYVAPLPWTAPPLPALGSRLIRPDRLLSGEELSLARGAEIACLVTNLHDDSKTPNFLIYIRILNVHLFYILTGLYSALTHSLLYIPPIFITLDFLVFRSVPALGKMSQ